MELSQQKKLVNHIFRLLKVNEIVFPIARTNKGNLGIKFTQSNDDFEIMLDAVPLSTKDILNDENNIELKRMLEKYWFDRTQPNIADSFGNLLIEPITVSNTPALAKIGIKNEDILTPRQLEAEMGKTTIVESIIEPTHVLHNTNGKTEISHVKEVESSIVSALKKRGRTANSK